MKVTLKEQVNIIKGIIKNAYTEAKMIIQSWTESNSRHSETCLQSYTKTYKLFMDMLDRDKKKFGVTTIKPESVKGLHVPEVILKPSATHSSLPVSYSMNKNSEFTNQRHPQQAM